MSAGGLVARRGADSYRLVTCRGLFKTWTGIWPDPPGAGGRHLLPDAAVFQAAMRRAGRARRPAGTGLADHRRRLDRGRPRLVETSSASAMTRYVYSTADSAPGLLPGCLVTMGSACGDRRSGQRGGADNLARPGGRTVFPGSPVHCVPGGMLVLWMPRGGRRPGPGRRLGRRGGWWSDTGARPSPAVPGGRADSRRAERAGGREARSFDGRTVREPSEWSGLPRSGRWPGALLVRTAARASPRRTRCSLARAGRRARRALRRAPGLGRITHPGRPIATGPETGELRGGQKKGGGGEKWAA